jgi:hypothetical protein
LPGGKIYFQNSKENSSHGELPYSLLPQPERAAGNLPSGQDGHEGHAVLVANQAVQMARFLVDEDNDVRFRERGG